MGQNVKSPLSNIRAETSKLHPCSSRLADADRRKSGPVLKSPLLFAAPAACGTAGAPSLGAISCLGAFRAPASGARKQISAAGVRKPCMGLLLSSEELPCLSHFVTSLHCIVARLLVA